MLLIFLLHLSFNYIDVYMVYVIGQVLLFFVIFYAFMFEHSFGIVAMVDDFKESLEGDRK